MSADDLAVCWPGQGVRNCRHFVLTEAFTPEHDKAMNKTAVVTVVTSPNTNTSPTEHTFTATITGSVTFNGRTFYDFALPPTAPASVQADYKRGYRTVPANRCTFA